MNKDNSVYLAQCDKIRKKDYFFVTVKVNYIPLGFSE